MRTFALRHALFAMLLGFLLTNTASAQLEGRLYLDKDEYQTGEPVYLHFDLKNEGTEPMEVISGSGYSFCGGYLIEVSSDRTHDPTSSCAVLGAGASCIRGGRVIAAGETWQDKVLLNYEHDLSKEGTYDIHASRDLTYGHASSGMPSRSSGVQVKADEIFHIRVKDGNAAELMPIFQRYVTDLNSKDEELRQEAARAIGSMAPSFLEDTILAMADSSTTRPFAIIGLGHLNTARAREALAKIVESTSGYSYDKEQAIKDLSEMQDKTYFPLLLAEAKKQEPNQAATYIQAAARLGGEDAMPYLTSLLASPNLDSRANSVIALALTGSRRAVPILVDLLRSPNVDIARVAMIGLVRLTHRSPFDTDRWFSDSPSNEYPDWARWWILRGNEVPAYGPTDCGKIEPLN